MILHAIFSNASKLIDCVVQSFQTFLAKHYEKNGNHMFEYHRKAKIADEVSLVHSFTFALTIAVYKNIFMCSPWQQQQQQQCYPISTHMAVYMYSHRSARDPVSQTPAPYYSHHGSPQNTQQGYLPSPPRTQEQQQGMVPQQVCVKYVRVCCILSRFILCANYAKLVPFFVSSGRFDAKRHYLVFIHNKT